MTAHHIRLLHDDATWSLGLKVSHGPPGLLAGGGAWQMPLHCHFAMTAAKGPGQTVPRPTMAGDWEVRQALAIDSVHHIPVPCTGNPVPERPNQAQEPLVLVVPATLAPAQQDHDALPGRRMPAVAQ
eukprot:3551876-Rhodomonas_salina.2